MTSKPGLFFPFALFSPLFFSKFCDFFLMFLLFAADLSGTAEESTHGARDGGVRHLSAGHETSQETVLAHHFAHSLKLFDQRADGFNGDTGTFCNTLAA